MQGIAWLVPIVALIGGCLGGGQDHSWEPFVFSTPQGFVAELPHGSTVTLSGPVTIPDGNGTGFQAYALRVAGEHNGAPTEFTSNLDANLRLVAVDHRCGTLTGACLPFVQWDWQDRGSVSSSGIGWPTLIQNGEFTSFAHRRAEPLAWDAQFGDDGTLQLVVKNSVFFPNETCRYLPGQMLAEGPGSFRNFSYEKGANLSGADTIYGPAPWPTARAWEGLMFRGEDEVAFGRGFTHRQIAEYAFTELKNGGKEPCVISYSMALYTLPLLTLGDVLEPAWTSVTTVRVLEENQVKWANVETWREPGGRNTMRPGETNTMHDVELGGITCETVRAATWPHINVTEGLSFARSLLKHGASMRWFEHTQYRLPCDPSDCGFAGGVPDWRFAFLPDGLEPGEGYYSVYEVYFEPVDGLPLKFIVAHPDDVLYR